MLFADRIVLLGSSRWPRLNYLNDDEGFSAAHGRARSTLSRAFNLGPSQILDLFDSGKSVLDQYGEIKSFLKDAVGADSEPDGASLRIVTYFIGHGGIFGDGVREYCLPVQASEEPYEAASSIRMYDLANVLASCAPKSLRVTVIDACFAGRAVSAFQADDQQILDATAQHALERAPTDYGNVVVCASDARSPAVLENGGTGTRFTTAFCDAIRDGDVDGPPFLSIRDVLVIAGARLRAHGDAPQPQLHTPRQVSQERELTRIPFVANPAYRALQGHDANAQTDLNSAAAALDAVVARRAGGSFVDYRGTVFDVPDGNEYWNRLAPDAKRTFILLGRTNKYWIQKSPSEAQRLAREMSRILLADGEVVIMSSPDQDVVGAHRRFFSDNFDQGLLGRYASRPRPHLQYRTVQTSAYDAVVADDRLVLMPNLNSEGFQSEAIVLEFTRHDTPQPFANYLADLHRLVETSSWIDLSQHLA